jgi:hypothetical protein
MKSKTYHQRYILIAIFIISIVIVLSLYSNARKVDPLPTLPEGIVRAHIEIQSIPDYGVKAETVDIVDKDDINILRDLISPVKLFPGSFNESIYFLTVIVYIESPSRNCTVKVYSVGKNPAAVSIEGMNSHYYVTRQPSAGNSDGAFEIIRFAQKRHPRTKN